MCSQPFPPCSIGVRVQFFTGISARPPRGKEMDCWNMKFYILIFSLFIEILSTGCGTTIAKNLRATNDRWDIDILEIRDGPNSAHLPGANIKATQGYRLIWLEVQIQNKTSAAQRIDLKDFALIYDQTIVPPAYYLFDQWFSIPSGSEFTLGPDESVRRRILYSIPIDKQPRLVRLPDVGDIPVQVLSARDGKDGAVK